MKYFFLFIVLCAACAPKVINTATTSERDSIAVKTIHHRDTIKIKGETVFVDRVIHDTVSFTIQKKEGRATETITNKGGKLTATCKCDSIKKALDFISKDTARYKFKTVTITRTIPVQFIPKFYKFTLWFFIIIVALAALLTGLRLKGKIPFL